MFGVARHNFYPAQQATGAGENANVPLWVAAVITAGGTVSAARRVLVSNLYNSLAADGITPLLGRLWLQAAENAGSAVVDLIARVSLTLVNSPTFTADRGYAGNGSSSYMNLGTGVCGTQNSASFAFYNRTNQVNADVITMGNGNFENSPANEMSIAWTDGNSYWAIQDTDGDTGRTAPATRSGIYVFSRTAVSTSPAYRNGTLLANSGITSEGTQARNFLAGAGNSSSPTGFTTNQIGMSMLGNSGGGGLTATQAANFTTHIQTYMTAIGA